jgi:hypothetical protein
MTLATQRLNAFVSDEILHPAYAYGSTTTAQACERMEKVVKVFEEAFNNTNNEKEGHEKGGEEHTRYK